MKKNLFWRIFALTLLLAALLAQSGCIGTETASPSPISTFAPTPTPALKIAGNNVEGHAGLIDVSDGIFAALGEGMEIQSAIFSDENTLLVLGSSEDNSVLMTYDLIAAAAINTYELPFVFWEGESISSRGVLSPLSNGGIVVADFINNRVIMLDDNLTETASYPNAVPPLKTDTYGDILAAYCEADSSFIYCYNCPNDANVYKITLDGEISTLYAQSGVDLRISKLRLTQDCSTLTINVTGDESQDPRENETARHCLTIDAHTGELISSTWLNAMSYSDGKTTASSKYYAHTSDLLFDGKKIDIGYINEYDQVAIAWSAKKAATAVNIATPDIAGCSFMLGYYDLTTGNQEARVCMKFDTYNSIAWSDFTNEFASMDQANGNVCVTYSNALSDTESQNRTLIWQPVKGTIEEVPNEWNTLLIPAGNVSFDGDNASVVARIEEKYGVKVYYGQSMMELFPDKEIGSAQVETFSDEADEQYIFECLLTLENALSEYPTSILKRLNESPDGQLCYFICTYLHDPVIDFEIVGQYRNDSGTQKIIVNLRAFSPEDFARGGNTGTFRSIIHHETCHAMQSYIFYIVDCDPAYDYDTWMSYYPEDFVSGGENNYDYIYGEDDEDIYFIDEYSTRTINEDMSRMFEYSMWDEIPKVLYSPRINARHKYFNELIRGAFDDGTWPECMMWERTTVNAESKKD